MEITQINKKPVFLEDVYFVLEKKDDRHTIWFTPRIFHEREDAIKFVKESQSNLKELGLGDSSKYFIFKGTSVDYS